MNRIYEGHEHKERINLLTEYYKFHNDVPRLFMMPIAEIIHNFYDKKRRLNYIKVTQMLKGEVDWGKFIDLIDSKYDLRIRFRSLLSQFESNLSFFSYI